MKVNISICGVTVANIETDDMGMMRRCVCASFPCDSDGIGGLIIDKLLSDNIGHAWVDDYLVSIVG